MGGERGHENSKSCRRPVNPPPDTGPGRRATIVYGIGVALSERISIKNGVVEQSNFYDYRVPRMNEVPPMHVEVIQTDNHPTGAGQMATPLVAQAISNAVVKLAGIRLRHTFTPERVKKASA
jgi:isoquinoline 1-oxidoreductase subunit beta